jgi:hypothetical protein
MDNNRDDTTIRETTQATISGYHVGVANIWERPFADANGRLAPRTCATLAVTNLLTKQENPQQDVSVGSVVTLGADRYLIVRVEEGNSGEGFIKLRKLAH